MMGFGTCKFIEYIGETWCSKRGFVFCDFCPPFLLQNGKKKNAEVQLDELERGRRRIGEP